MVSFLYSIKCIVSFDHSLVIKMFAYMSHLESDPTRNLSPMPLLHCKPDLRFPTFCLPPSFPTSHLSSCLSLPPFLLCLSCSSLSPYHAFLLSVSPKYAVSLSAFLLAISKESNKMHTISYRYSMHTGPETKGHRTGGREGWHLGIHLSKRIHITTRSGI